MALLRYVMLPSAMSGFERTYLARMNRVGLWFLALHVPVFMLVAWVNGTGALLAGALSLAVLAGPAIAYATLKNPRAVSVTFGIAAMFMGGVLVHVGQGPAQIEMHFYFFALIAMLAVYANPLVILAAAATVALHHLALWALVPRSVFNYEAPVWVVAVHALFVILESVAGCFIARSFFDNVIGLEKIVEERTRELDRRNHDMRLVLDTVDQGFLIVDAKAQVSSERSAIFDRWFGAPPRGVTLFQHLASVSPDFAQTSEVAWEEVVGGVMPLALTLEQMPRHLEVNGAHYSFTYAPVGTSETPVRFLIVISDVSSEVERKRGEVERREAMTVFEHLTTDRSGFEMFYEEASGLIEAITTGVNDDVALKRMLHTLKGNCGIFGLESVGALCHDMESRLSEDGALTASDLERLVARWARLASAVEKLVGIRGRVIEVDPSQHAAIESAITSGTSPDALLRMVRALKLEPAERRLKHFAEQAKRIATRLDKEAVDVRVDDHGVLLDAKQWSKFWSAFVHAIRNAVDHGTESADRRRALGKPERGQLVLRTHVEQGKLAIEVEDDGPGIDWQRVARKATELGLPSATMEDLQAVVFHDGVSTAARVTDVSGRGIGLGALLSATESLGGRIELESREGRGTTVRMLFPDSLSSTASATVARFAPRRRLSGNVALATAT